MAKARTPANRRQEVERAVLRHAHEQPEWGQARVAEAMVKKGLKVSAAGVRWIWQRHGLETAAKRAGR
ncbi:MAG: hypothetical protein IPG33_04150 [Betaproteobacteria bacterium]|nr:hypothetical protein [Betaproteobacteria bacterium]